MRFEGTGNVNPQEVHRPGIPVEPVPPIVPAEVQPAGMPVPLRRPAEVHEAQEKAFAGRLMAALDRHIGQIRQPKPHNGDRRGKRQL